MKVYLSGPIERVADDNELSWFDDAELKLSCAGLNPFNPMKEGCELLIKAGLAKTVTALETETPTEFLHRRRLVANAEFGALKKNPDQLTRFRALMNILIEKDMYEVARSNAVLVHLSPAIAGGTSGEITLARHLGIPVVGFCPLDPCLVGGWNLGTPDFLFTGPKAYEEAINYIIDNQDVLAAPGSFELLGLT